MLNLEELTSKMKAQESVANTNLDDVPYHQRPAWETAIRQSGEALGLIKKDYAKAVANASLYIFLEGSPASVTKFVETARSAAGAFVLNGSEFYEKLANTAWSASNGAGTAFNTNQLSLVDAQYQREMENFGYPSMNTLNFSEYPLLNSLDETLAYVKRVCRTANGDGPNFKYLQNLLTGTLYKESYSKATIPVVVINTSKEEAQSLSRMLVEIGGQPAKVENFVNLGEDLDEDSVMLMLGQIKKKVPKKTQVQEGEK